MSGDVFGRVFRVSSFGESHGSAVGCIVEGCPAGLVIGEEDIARELERRRPGLWGRQGRAAAISPRAEPDLPEILSGLFEGRTTGAPLAILVRSVDARSGDYESHRGLFRPGRGDSGWSAKYGHRDHRGGGRLSGRETVARVAAGAVAKRLLSLSGIEVYGFTLRAAGLSCPPLPLDRPLDAKERAAIESNVMRCPDAETAALMLDRVQKARDAGDSVGGIVECRARGLPPGLGEPVFEGLDALLGAAALSIPGVKGMEIGLGFASADLRGSEYLDAADPPLAGGPGLSWRTNRAGGVAGGLSTGAELILRVAVKPAPSIAVPVPSVDEQGKALLFSGPGRHDACLCPRIVPVLEAMAALVLADCLLLGRAARV